MLELRPALRRLAARPVVSLVTVATLALGIGSLTTAGSAVESILLRPLPFAEPERLVRLFHHPVTNGAVDWEASHTDFRAWREATTRFADLAGFATVGGHSVVRFDRRLDQAAVQLVSWNLFRLLGVSPLLGRDLEEGDDRAGAAPVALIGEAVWERRFGRDRAVLGRTLEVEGVAHEIVGVMPRSADFPVGAELWVPVSVVVPPPLLENQGVAFFNLVGRLAPGATAEEARQELDRLADTLTNPSLPPSRRTHTTLVSLDEHLRGDTRSPLAFLAAAAALVLLLAVLNVGNLLAVREVGARQETAVRLGLGAGFRDLLGRAVGEAAILAALGAGAGIVAGERGLAALARLFPRSLFRVGDLRLDLVGLGLAAGTAVVLTLGLGAALAAASLRIDPGSALRAGSRAGGDGHRAVRLLVVGQVAVALVIVLGAGLLVRSYLRLARADMGFERERVLSFAVPILDPALQDPQAQYRIYEALLAELATLPGVEATGGVFIRPLDTDVGLDALPTIEGRPESERDGYPLINLVPATPDAFAALGIRLREGRGILASDDETASPVVVVGEAVAARLWSEGGAVGSRIQLGAPESGAPWVEVVGVVADGRFRHAESTSWNAFVPHRQSPWGLRHLVVRVARGGPDPWSLLPALRETIARHGGGLEAVDVATMGEVVERALAGRRFVALLVGGFAAVALALATIGLYGVVAFLAALGRREVGVRMALGATPQGVLALVVARALALAGAGLALGLAAALALLLVAGERLAPWLYEIGPRDPAVFAAAVSTLLLAAVVAALAPALKSSRLDPARVLRGE